MPINQRKYSEIKEFEIDGKNIIRLPRHSINRGGELLVIARVLGNADVFLRDIYDRIFKKKIGTC